ncbi:MAG: T9SS type A sorting domain-containing protein [Bacteroidetes bacterium]|nr:T9SS type A sorting domain-containing protein [Bacteroidota bacterium]
MNTTIGEWFNDAETCFTDSNNVQLCADDQFVVFGGGNLPVELTSFDATVDGEAVILRWTTASETNNAGFDVQVLDADGAAKSWSTLTFVEGHGTTELPKSYSHRATDLTPGTHTFRLKQVDFDGAFEYSPEVEVVIGLPEQYVVEPAYPNPFNPEATLRFAVQQEQRVEVGLYNLLGQRVQTLFAGTATSGQMQRVTIDGGGLSSGVYLVRVQGERFLETQRVTLVK